MGRKVYIDNKPLDEALSLLLNTLQIRGELGVRSEQIPVTEARGRFTSEPVWARKSSPHYSASAMDGIAVIARDTFSASETTPVVLKRDSQFVEVDTGDPVPNQFDAVIMIEDVNFKDDNSAEIIVPAVPWQHIRSVGEDVIASQMMVPAGWQVGPFEIGAFLTAGVNTVAVARKPRVVIIPTGTELVEPGRETAEPGEITESNSRVLAALCEEWGALPTRLDIVVDDKEALRQAVEKAVAVGDIIVICSGSSAGREDYTADIISNLGELLLHGLAIKPGKPAMLGIIGHKPVIGVPGYPVSAALIFEMFAKPLISAYLGIEAQPSVELKAGISRKLASNMGVDEFVHVNLGRIGGRYLAFPLSRGAGITTSLAKSDGILQIPRGVEGYQAGDTVNIKLHRSVDVIDRTILAIGSHDMALDYLGNILWNKDHLRLASTNVGSMGGIMSLKRRETHIAGIHLLDTVTGDYNVSYLQRYLAGEKVLLINLVIRGQGLMVSPGNPLNIKSIEDLADDRIRFVNRQNGAGTRILFDYLLKEKKIDRSLINGYGREEFSHLAVAAAVANGTADASLGIYASAKALGLDFVPVAEERYDLCLLPDIVDEKMVDALMEAVRSPLFVSETEKFGGYDLRLSGRIMWEN